MKVTRGVWIMLEGEHSLVIRFLDDIAKGRLPTPIARGGCWGPLDGAPDAGCTQAFADGDTHVVETWIAEARRESIDETPDGRRAQR